MGYQITTLEEKLIEPLTPREQDVLRLLNQHLRYQDIAEQLNLALSSVKWFVQQIYGKLGVHNRRDAMLRAHKLGLLEIEGKSSISIAGLSSSAKPMTSGLMTVLAIDFEDPALFQEQRHETMQAFAGQLQTILRQIIESYEGQIIQAIGTTYQAVFWLASQGVCAAIAVQRSIETNPWGTPNLLKVRMGLHTGPMEINSVRNPSNPVNQTLSRVTQIVQAGHGGQILLSQEAKNHVEQVLPEGVSLKDLGKNVLKGLLHPEHLYQIIRPGFLVEFPPLKAERRPNHNLPPELTPFIGRESDIKHVVQLLKEHRLVTLTGSGGVGKTRLSIQVAERLLPEMPDGVWFVELAPVSDPEMLPQTLAFGLGLREEASHPILDTLMRFLSNRHLLLVLDNCEHILPDCAQLANIILRSSPGIKLLTSSREAFRINGEYPYRVPSLSIPDKHANPSTADLQKYEAVQLFVERAQVALPDFALHANNVAAIATICRRLDGIPLALELAAARLNFLTPQQLAGRMDSVFQVLTGGSRTALPRHQTLRAMIDWSYQLLSAKEQVLLQRLAVFSGGGTLATIEVICAGEGIEEKEILDLLTTLVNRSMVNIDRKQPEEVRFYLLETVRQYARENLISSGALDSIRGRHLDYFMALCEEAFPHIHGAGRLEWFYRLKREYTNIREALEWSINDSKMAVQGLRISTALIDRFWSRLGMHREANYWLEAGLRAGAEEIPKLLKAKIYYSLSYYKVFLSTDQAVLWFEKCVTLCREIGPEADRVLCLAWRNRIVSNPNIEQSQAEMREALRIARSLGPVGTWELGECLFFYALALSFHPQGTYDDEALAAAEESLQVNQAGDRWSAGGYWVIGQIQTLRGLAEQARHSLETALERFKEVDDYVGIKFTLYFLAWHFRRTGQYQMVQRCCKYLFECVDAVADEDGYAMFAYSAGMMLVNKLEASSLEVSSPAVQNAIKSISFASKFQDDYGDWAWFSRFKPRDIKSLEQLHQQLGEPTYSSVWKEGQSLSIQEAVALSLDAVVEVMP